VFEQNGFEAALEREALEQAKRAGLLTLSDRDNVSESDLLESYNNYKCAPILAIHLCIRLIGYPLPFLHFLMFCYDIYSHL
jgi:hypothetical protein